MRRCEVAVIGQGLMGAAALDALLRMGVDAVGFDPLEVGSSLGSSHGSCRVFRRFNFENPHYTALSDEALSGWDRLAIEAGRQLLLPCPILEAGPPGSEAVRNSRQAAVDMGQDVPLLTGAQVNARFPAFALPDGWDAVVQDGGAILLTELALGALRARAVAQDRIRPLAVTALEEAGDHVVVRAGEEVWRAGRVILAAGPWMSRFLPALAPVLAVTRQTVGWFASAKPESTGLGRFPIFIIERSKDDTVYGFPDFEGRGVKAAPHNHGPVVGADAWEPPASDAELAQVSRFLAELIPGAAGPITERDVCLYTNTRPSAEDAGEEFIIDRWPDSRLPESRLVVGSACSGHGAKFAPAIGERLARLAIEPDYQAEPFFRLARYPELQTSTMSSR